MASNLSTREHWRHGLKALAKSRRGVLLACVGALSLAVILFLVAGEFGGTAAGIGAAFAGDACVLGMFLLLPRAVVMMPPGRATMLGLGAYALGALLFVVATSAPSALADPSELARAVAERPGSLLLFVIWPYLLFAWAFYCPSGPACPFD